MSPAVGRREELDRVVGLGRSPGWEVGGLVGRILLVEGRIGSRAGA